jgi:uncharacterized protein YkwD
MHPTEFSPRLPTARPRVHRSRGALATVVLALVLATGVPVEAASGTAQVLKPVNQHRRAAGCGELVRNTALARAAQAHARDMARNDYVSHTSLTGATFTTRISNTGYRYSWAAENTAAGFRTPKAVVAAWMQSPGHRANILNCRLTESGVGYAYNRESTYGAYWVQVFATPR